MNLFVLLSGGGEALFVGLAIGLLTLLVSFIYNSLKPKVQQVTTNIMVNVNPNDVKNLIKKGYFEIEKKEYTLAINYFQKAINIDSNNLDAISGVAFAYHMIKDYTNSKKYIEDFQNKATIDSIDYPLTAIITYLYGHICYMEGNIDQAVTCKENAIIMAKAKLSDDTTIIINKLNLY